MSLIRFLCKPSSCFIISQIRQFYILKIHHQSFTLDLYVCWWIFVSRMSVVGNAGEARNRVRAIVFLIFLMSTTVIYHLYDDQYPTFVDYPIITSYVKNYNGMYRNHLDMSRQNISHLFSCRLCMFMYAFFLFVSTITAKILKVGLWGSDDMHTPELIFA